MDVYCFDNDKSTEKLLKSILQRGEAEVSKFYFNEKISNITDSGKEGSIAFIDTRIQGKRQNSFSLAGLIREKFKDCHIVFMSAYPEDMAHCFKNLIRPSGFLLKPLFENEVLSIYYAVDSYIHKRQRIKTITISTHDCKRIIELDKIVYFSTISKKIFCRLKDNERVEFYGTISNLEKEYTDNFTRCHSGFLVNKQYIKAIRKNELELFYCDERIPISKRYRPLIKDDYGID